MFVLLSVNLAEEVIRMAMTHLTTPTRWFRRSGAEPVSRMQSGSMTRDNDPLARMHEQMNQLFDNFFGDAGWSMDRPLVDGSNALMQPQLDIFETDKEYRLSVELPGVERDDIDLSIDDDALVIRARKERRSEDVDEDRYHRVERSYGRFERMLTLPMDADTEKIGAELKNGVLEVTIPRRDDIETTSGRRIDIKGG
ncbi:Hsp20/alpha crystallin family protein [Wenzhouxiangella sp. 15190]|nr:Hsp20/alpha crystallin family protein [Wenzhouxiangella sp. 15190]